MSPERPAAHSKTIEELDGGIVDEECIKAPLMQQEPIIYPSKVANQKHIVAPVIMDREKDDRNVVFHTFKCSCSAKRRNLILVPRIYSQWFSQRTIENDMEVVLHVYLVDINSCKENYFEVGSITKYPKGLFRILDIMARMSAISVQHFILLVCE